MYRYIQSFKKERARFAASPASFGINYDMYRYHLSNRQSEKKRKNSGNPIGSQRNRNEKTDRGAGTPFREPAGIDFPRKKSIRGNATACNP